MGQMRGKGEGEKQLQELARTNFNYCSWNILSMCYIAPLSMRQSAPVHMPCLAHTIIIVIKLMLLNGCVNIIIRSHLHMFVARMAIF